MSRTPGALYSAINSDVGGYFREDLSSLSEAPPDLDYKQFCAFTLLRSLLKKWPPTDTKDADDASFQDFASANNRCKEWDLRLCFEHESELWGEFLRELDMFFHPRGQVLFSSYFDILKHARMGPGAAIGSKSNSFYAKLFSSKMAVTSTSLYRLYRDYISWFPDWADAEAIRYAKYGFPSVVDCSRSSFVPKTSSKSRMICVEPSLNVFFQLGLAHLLTDRLVSAYQVDLSYQAVKNRLLAKRGSEEGSFATIDLKSASDSISLILCHRILPKYVYDVLFELRCPKTRLMGQVLDLGMVSTMGNGFTFPLQTIIFSCMIRAAMRFSEIEIRDGTSANWGCFGDDLIVPSGAVRPLLRLLELSGMTVNSSKSFFEGPFRESCGADWFRGQYCRGVYLKRLQTRQDILVAVNLLNEWSARTGIPLNRGVRYLLDGLRDVNPVPFEESNDAGLRVPSCYLEGKFRYDKNLTVLYRKFEVKSKRIFFGDGVIRYPKGVRRSLMYNPAGLYISYLLGEVVSCSISIRHDDVRYRSKLGRSLFWDYVDFSKPSDGIGLEWRRWETAVLVNTSNP